MNKEQQEESLRSPSSSPPDDELNRSLNETRSPHSQRRAPRPRFWSHGDTALSCNRHRGLFSTQHGDENIDALVTKATSPRRRRAARFREVTGKPIVIPRHQTTTRRSVMAGLRRASQRLYKSARVYSHKTKHSKDIHMVFFQSTPALAIYAFLTMATCCRQTIFLYGIPLVLLAQISWIGLKWSLYVLDDPELHTMHTFIKGWITVLMREGSRVVSGKSPRALWIASTVAREIPLGVGLARVYVRNFTHRVNHQMMDELRHHLVRYSHDEKA